jgi:hypothetical protein
MATHGEIRWPSAGSFSGRLRGGSHGRRHPWPRQGTKPAPTNREQRREFVEALLEADTFEDVPGKWQAAILKGEQNRPKLRSAATR